MQLRKGAVAAIAFFTSSTGRSPLFAQYRIAVVTGNCLVSHYKCSTFPYASCLV